MGLIDLIFGRKKVFNHPYLGNFTSQRIKSNNSLKTYYWIGDTCLVNNNGDEFATSLFINGNTNSPYNNQLSFISELVQNWKNDYFLKIEEEINTQGFSKKEELKNWENEFYLSAIYANNAKALDFELTLESIHFELTLKSTHNVNYPTISVTVKNAIISKVDLYT
ncbi:MAG: hypothetical protein ACSHW4_14340 [Cellulophaga sp.]|uniref:hypothetical protein n=1 Tax=Cellulophaga sp. RHA19 TaxID=1798237 RepID=UPI000C2B896B|nr:hypothetical protein [Cellulophaga sp. RHA19]PKB43612.1 hypothetical protein AX016_1815 [Cellulophaga sp. RHA19]